MKRALLIHYHFLPLNHAGAGHLLGHARHLKAAGWDSTVLTGRWDELGPTEMSFGMTWEPETESLLSRMPQILRVPLAEPRFGCIASALTRWNLANLGHMAARIYPDRFGPWIAPAMKAAVRQHRRTPFDAIVSYCPPETNVALGSALSRRLGIPFVVCFGDLYGFHGVPEPDRLGAALQDLRVAAKDGLGAVKAALNRSIERNVDSRMRRRWMRSAQRCTAVSPFMAAHVETSFRVPTDVVVVGFDDDEFPVREPPPGRDRMVISHVGSLYPSQYYDGGQRLDVLLDGIDAFLAAHPEAVEQIAIRFVGSRHDGHINIMLDGRPCQQVCRTMLKVDSRRALAYVRDSDALLAFTLTAGHGGTLSYPGKIFEAFGARRPILVIPSDHDWVKLVLEDTGGGETADDAASVADVLARWHGEWRRTGRAAPPGREAVIPQFGQAAQSRRLAATMDAAVEALRTGKGRRLSPGPRGAIGAERPLDVDALARITLVGAAIRPAEPHDLWKVVLTDPLGVRRHSLELGAQEIEQVLRDPHRSFVVRYRTPRRGGTWTVTPHVAGRGWRAPISGPIAVPATEKER